MKNVKEIALELDVTIQTIYNHIKKNEKELKGCIAKIQNINYLDDQGIRIIKESMGLIQVPMKNQEIGLEEIIEDISSLVTANIALSIRQDMDNLYKEIEELKEQNKLLIELVKEKRKQEEKKGIFNWFKK